MEDKIAAGLSLQQLALLALPAFVDLALYGVVPPAFHIGLFKLGLTILITTTGCLMAVRFKGKIVLSWLVTIARYNSRPRYYVFNKNDNYLRSDYNPPLTIKECQASPLYSKPPKHKDIKLTDQEKVRLSGLLAGTLKLNFVTHKKTGLRVHITEVKH